MRVILSIPISLTNPPPAPNGLGLIQPELVALGVSYVGMVNFNKQVYMPFYMGIIKNLLFGLPAQGIGPEGTGSALQKPAATQEPPTEPVASK